MKKISLWMGLLLSSSLLMAEEIPTLHLTLEQTVQQTLKTSPRYQAVRFDYEAAQKHASSQRTTLYPRLSFDAYYRYQTEVPEFKPVPNGPMTKFGDNKNYSYGPAVNWTFWDSGGNHSRWKSSQAVARSKFFDEDAVQRQLVLEARVAYLQVQLSAEQVRSFGEALILAEQQYKDIAVRQKVGTLSRIDLLESHQVLLTRERELRESRINLALALRELFALTGFGADTDPSIPFGLDFSKKMPVQVEKPTLLIDLDPLIQTETFLSPVQKASLDLNHPQLEALEQTAEAVRRNASAFSAQHGPTFQLTAKATRDYPNGPVLETIQQNTVGVVASLPLFEFNRVTNEVKALKAQAQSAEQKKEQTRLNLTRDWQKAHDQLIGLFAERDINEVALEEARKLATLVYDSYTAGRSTYLEVENANYRVLLADVQSARTHVQISIQLALLDSLAAKN